MNKSLSTTEVKVSIDFGKNIQTIGRLAARERTVYFEYDGAFIRSGIEISPIHLPLQPGVKSFDCNLFEGLPGVFNDSLPDGWGRLLLDRLARSLGILPADITPLDRLTHVGTDALGALIYEPDHSANDSQFDINLDNLASQTQKVLDGTSEEVFSELIALNGSSAGARPKAMIGVSNERDHVIHGIGDLPNGYRPSIVKFPNNQDGIDAGAIEYIYALMAKEAGIFMPRVRLFPAERGTGYFAIERFDRDGGKRLHMHTACGLLHSDFRTPSLDYEDLIALTGLLTRDVREVEKLYQLAVFNVLAHNRDDHLKNFSYLMDHCGEWKLSPAYDLTFSSGPQGEQSTMVMGEGRNPNTNHLLQLAEEAKIKQGRAVEIIKTTKASLAQWSTLAKHYGVSDANIELIQKKIIEQIE
ncbi:MAG: type II toxin-antitoxin system HipA family toxin [Aestuariivita sp.]|nr:type II toxin-antitoxin system HipA family toxin [Aestuariivita sp.]MCY4345739.1 type II toxin-antitoxin system HipA family toxin [Aestuariivita sp.]